MISRRLSARSQYCGVDSNIMKQQATLVLILKFWTAAPSFRRRKGLTPWITTTLPRFLCSSNHSGHGWSFASVSRSVPHYMAEHLLTFAEDKDNRGVANPLSGVSARSQWSPKGVAVVDHVSTEVLSFLPLSLSQRPAPSPSPHLLVHLRKTGICPFDIE